MNTIKQRAHEYAMAHQHKADGIALMRAYVAGAQSERKRTKVFYLRQSVGDRILRRLPNLCQCRQTIILNGLPSHQPNEDLQEALVLGKMYGKVPVGDNVLRQDIPAPQLERKPWREDRIPLGKVFKEKNFITIVITKTE